MKIKLADLNRLDRSAFTDALGNLFEHSPWIPEATWEQRPFATLQTLHQALVNTVEQASLEQQIALIQAHPDLAGKLAISGKLTAESVDEQQSAQLDQLTPELFEKISALNHTYREKFQFPFVICVKDHTQASIFKHFAERVGHDRAQEITTALNQISRIAWHRLQQTLA